MTDWQPIDTAPKSGEIILWNGEEVVAGCYSVSLGWASSFETGQHSNGLPLYPPPTHWTPLPQMPLTTGGMTDRMVKLLDGYSPDALDVIFTALKAKREASDG